MNRSKAHKKWKCRTKIQEKQAKTWKIEREGRKEGEEKAHEDGGMVGWSRHLEDGDSKMSVQAATWGNHGNSQDKTSEEGTKLSNALSKIEYSFSNQISNMKNTKAAP